MQDLTTGSISKHLLKTASFMLVTMVFQTLYFLVDLYWVGSLGKEAVAGVGVAGNLTFIVLAVSQMLGVGTTTLVSHAAGQKNAARALLVFNQSQVLSMLVGLLFLAVSMIFRTAYAHALSADEATAAQAADYLLYFLPAMGLQFGMVAMASALRGVGNFRPGMVVQTATVIINIVLAPVPHLRLVACRRWAWRARRSRRWSPSSSASCGSRPTSSAARATCASRARICGRNLPLWKDMLKIGLPAGAEFGMMAVYLMLVYVLARPFGAAAQAGFGIGMRVVQALFMPVVALGFSVAPVAGQNVGARLGDRVKAVFKDASLMAAGWMLLMAVLCNIAPAALIRVFSNDPAVIAVGDEYLRIVVVDLRRCRG